MPLRTLVPEEHAVGRAGQRRAGAATAPACFSTGKLSPVSTASLTKQSVASRITRVGRHQAAGGEQHDVAGHEVLDRHRRGAPSRNDRGARVRTRARSACGGCLRAVLARVADERRVAETMVSTIAASDPSRRVSADDDGGEHQQQQQRTAQLARQHPPARQRALLAQLIRPVMPQPLDRPGPQLSARGALAKRCNSSAESSAQGCGVSAAGVTSPNVPRRPCGRAAAATPRDSP